jgi:hypothetical protein
VPRYRIHGSLYEPSCDGADKDGYIHFWEVVDAPTADEALAITHENYGEYNTLHVHGIAHNAADAKSWLGQNDD